MIMEVIVCIDVSISKHLHLLLVKFQPYICSNIIDFVNVVALRTIVEVH